MKIKDLIEKTDPCWKGHKQIGTKKKDGKTVPNCVPESTEEETLQERKIHIRINSKGQRLKKIKCPPGKVLKTVNGRKVCATPTGKERLSKRISIKKSVRTKNAKGSGYKKRTNFKRQKAMKKRRQQGL
jgi:hypothetical protein